MFDTGRTMAKYQLYFDGKICGNPMLMEPMAVDPEIGWEDDNQTYDNGLENDKQMRNRGWMKAPDSYNNYTPTGNIGCASDIWVCRITKVTSCLY